MSSAVRRSASAHLARSSRHGHLAGFRRRLPRLAAAGLLGVAAVAAVPAGTASAAAGGDELTAGQTLTAGQQLQNGVFALVMGDDGNLDNNACGHTVWASGTPGHPGAHLVMQSDGNLVIYATNGAAVWSTGTAGHPGAFAILGNDDNLVVVLGSTPLWQSGTEGDANCRDRLFAPGQFSTGGQLISGNGGVYRFIATTDGAAIFDLRSESYIWAWNCGPYYSSDYTVEVFAGNLFLISPGSQYACETGTSTPGGSYLMMQENGDLVLYTDWHTLLWHSGS